MDIPRNWRLRGERLRLEGSELSCGHKVFPPRPTCPYCISLENNIPDERVTTRPTEQVELEDKNLTFLCFLLFGFIITILYVNKNSK